MNWVSGIIGGQEDAPSEVAPTAAPENSSPKDPNAVTLHIYDVGSDAVVSALNKSLKVLGTGAFHAAVEVRGEEWSFGYCEGEGSGVFSCEPTKCDMHIYREAVPMGNTEEKDVGALVEKLKAEWVGKDYDLLRRNCCHFSDTLCQALGVGPIPAWVSNLAGAAVSLNDAGQQAAGAVTAAAVMAAAKAGKVDEQYGVSGTVKAQVAEMLEKGKELDQKYKVSDTTSDLVSAAKERVNASRGSKGLIAAAYNQTANVLAPLAGAAAAYSMTATAVMAGRLETAKAGKELLDRGGEEAAMMIVAKKVSRDVALSDCHLVQQQLESINALYLHSAADIALSLADMGSVEDAEKLIKQYSERQQLYQEIQVLLGDPVEGPTLKTAESDAIALLMAKDQYSWAGDMLGEGLKLRGVTKQGSITKRGPTPQFGWEVRWCVLEARKLVYYTEATQKERKGDIPLLETSLVFPFPSPVAPGDSIKYSKEKPHGFVIDVDPDGGKNRKLYYFDAQSPEELDAWSSAIKAAVRLLAPVCAPSKSSATRNSKLA